MRETFIVIPANGRHQMIAELLGSINYPQDHVILLDTGAEPPLEERFGDDDAMVISQWWFDGNKGKNIQRWWNAGWRMAEGCAEDKNNYAVVFLNSDAMTNRWDIETMVEAIDKYDASVVFFDHCSVLNMSQINRRTRPGPGPWHFKMTGWGFAVRGEIKTRFDETMAWWYGDDDFDWRARLEYGGVVMIHGPWVANRDPNGGQRDNPELHEVIARDHNRFIEKWGVDIMDDNVFNEETFNRMITNA